MLLATCMFPRCSEKVLYSSPMFQNSNIYIIQTYICTCVLYKGLGKGAVLVQLYPVAEQTWQNIPDMPEIMYKIDNMCIIVIKCSHRG